MRMVMFIIGIVCVLAGLFFTFLSLLDEKLGKRTLGITTVLAGVLLLVLGSNLGDKVSDLELGDGKLKMSFAQQAAVLTPQQNAGAQRAQLSKLSEPPPSPTADQKQRATNFLSHFQQQIDQGSIESLHRKLAVLGFTPAPDPTVDMSPGTIVRVGQDGALVVLFTRLQAFPQLKLRYSDFYDLADVRQRGPVWITSSFECHQPFRLDMDLASYAVTPISLDANAALRQDPSVYVVRTGVGCDGRGGFPLATSRYFFGFQLATPVQR